MLLYEHQRGVPQGLVEVLVIQLALEGRPGVDVQHVELAPPLAKGDTPLRWPWAWLGPGLSPFPVEPQYL